MLLKPVSLAFAAASLIGIATLPAARAQMAGTDQMVTNGPQANVENQAPDWSARQNVVQSHRYDKMVETSRSFRDARMQKECGPITDPQLHQNCIASFNQDEPSTAPARPRHRNS